jgi:hypothetical protein
MKLLVVNPNTSASMTARIGAAARAAAAAGDRDRRGQYRERSRLDRGKRSPCPTTLALRAPLPAVGAAHGLERGA